MRIPLRFGASVALAASAIFALANPATAATHLQWDQVFHGPADLGVAISAVDPGNGHEYTVAAFNADGSQQTVEVRAYSSAGSQLWAATLPAAKQSIDRPLAAAVDPANHRLVVVTKTAASGVLARAYSSSGSVVWTRTVTSSGVGITQFIPTAAGYDGRGRIVVAGGTQGGVPQITVMAFDASSGAVDWVDFHAGPGGAFDYFRGMAIDAVHGQVYIDMFYEQSRDHPRVLAYRSDTGALLWTAASPVESESYASGIAVDSFTGHVVVARTDAFPGSQAHASVSAFAADGSPLWTTDLPVAGVLGPIATDPEDGSIYAAGTTVLALDLTGHVRWRDDYYAAHSEVAASVIVDQPSERIVSVAGDGQHLVTRGDTDDGQLRWTSVFGTTNGNTAPAALLSADPTQGRVYAVAKTGSTGTVTLSYAP